jgi:enterochelin esterase-like enzyme
MKKFVIYLVIAISLINSLMSQPHTGSGFSLYRNLEYTSMGGINRQLDIYAPGGKAPEVGVGLVGKDPKRNEPAKTLSNPVIIWLAGKATNNFPTPVASYVGNGYTVVSLQYQNESEQLSDIYQAIGFLAENAPRYNIDTRNTGILLPVHNGYLAFIQSKGAKKLKSISDAESILKIVAPDDSVFSKLQSSAISDNVIGFFDKHLRNGNHIQSDPLNLKCPEDSWVDPITNPIPGTSFHMFPTPVRGENKYGSYLIYLPGDYNTSNKKYPVIYWLHGGLGNSREGSWMCDQMNKAILKGEMSPTIIVFVQGLPIGWYNNSKDGTMPVEDVIIKDLIPHIDATYRTINKREARGIEGMSMGGYGSLHLGFKYPELFGVISSIAPSITKFKMERKEVIAPTFEDDSVYFNINAPGDLIQKNRDYIRKNTTIRLLIGDKDFLFNLVQQFHQQLKDLQIPHQYAVAKDADHDYKEVISKLGFDSFSFWLDVFSSTEYNKD